MTSSDELPILIIGAGVSGLLLAQHLKTLNIPFLVFERDSSFATRGAGWGLTLQWSLPAIHQLLPKHLLERFPTTFVDREGVENGAVGTFPFFDLSTGKEVGRSPKAGPDLRVRVTREKLRRLFADGIDVQVQNIARSLPVVTLAMN